MITSAEWVGISHSLEQHHALFYQCWQMGRPRFTDAIPTAAVRFSRQTGDYLDFLFNPTFWESLTPYERLFVIAHESLHVLLNHGLRTVDAKDNVRTNVALDIVVNHMLVNNFGFDRSQVRNQADLCWVDTVFEGQSELAKIPTDAAFEYYLNLIPARPVLTVTLVDDHSDLPGQEPIGKLNDRLSPDELETLKGVIDKHCQNPSQGAGLGGVWDFARAGPVKKSKKWETIIKDWSKLYLRQVDRHREQWLRVNRRFSAIQGSLLLPSEQEESEQQGDRVGVYFFLDTSGSCYHLKDRFFQAALSLPTERFVIRLFCFDTKVEETTLESGRIYGGGGTSFHIIEQRIEEIVQQEQINYPESVFVVTDGHGTAVTPKHPERWHWFLTPHHSRHFVPSGSKCYNLADYE